MESTMTSDFAKTESTTTGSKTGSNTDQSTARTETATSRRNAIVTGVAKKNGIGWAIVKEFVGQGYRVVGADIKSLEEEDQAESSGLSIDDFFFVQADVSHMLEARKVVDCAVAWFGQTVHALINNAGIGVRESSTEDFAKIVAMNLNSAYNMSTSILRYVSAGLSSVVHVSSTRALQSDLDTVQAYTASKAGLLGLTHSQAITHSGVVRVNAVLPGWISAHPLREDLELHPVGRVGRPKDVADLCLFLCDDSRAGFITGQQFVVDGGATMKMIFPEELDEDALQDI